MISEDDISTHYPEIRSNPIADLGNDSVIFLLDKILTLNTPLNQLEEILNFAQLICQLFTRKFSNITELLEKETEKRTISLIRTDIAKIQELELILTPVFLSHKHGQDKH